MRVELIIRNFRSINETSLQLDDGINVLIGPNGSGKSNILSAIRFLSDTLNDGAAVAMGRAGGPQRNYRKNSNEIQFRVTTSYARVKIDHEPNDLSLTWDLTVAPRGQDKIPAITHESIIVHKKDAPSQKIFSASIERPASRKPRMRLHLISQDRAAANLFRKPNGKNFTIAKSVLFNTVKQASRDFLKRTKRASNDRTIIQAFASLHPSILGLVRNIKSVDEFNIEPEKARQPSDQLPLARMKNDGSGLSDVLHALQTRQVHRLYGRTFYSGEKLQSFIQMPGVQYWHMWALYDPHQLKLPATVISKQDLIAKIENELSSAIPAIDSLGTEIDTTSGRRYVTFKRGEISFRPNEVSDGTIKWLCLLVALHLPYSFIFQLEEPENFMHPWMQQRLVELIREHAKPTKAIYLCTSHSATILNCLKSNELIIVTNDGGGTTTSKISNPASVNKYLQDSKFGLGDLWVSGGLGAVP